MRLPCEADSRFSSEALLRQPGGFEGFGVVKVGPNPDQLAVLEVSDNGVRGLGVGPASSAAGADMAEPNDAITKVPVLRVLDLRAFAEGDPDDTGVWFGEAAGLIDAVEPAATIVERMVTETTHLLRSSH